MFLTFTNLQSIFGRFINYRQHKTLMRMHTPPQHEPTKFSKFLATIKVFQNRTQSYISLFNLSILISVWFATTNGSYLWLIGGLALAIFIGLMDWKYVFRAEQQIYFKNNPEWKRELEEINKKIDILINSLNKK